MRSLVPARAVTPGLALLVPLALAASPAGAQQTPAPPLGAPNVAAANNAVAAKVEAQGAAQADAQAQHAADLVAYDRAVHAYRRNVVRTAIEDDRRRAAYADAMTAWRAQVAACHDGDGPACRAPAPDPSAFY